MVDTTIYIGNLAIHEPVTALTDYIITCLGFYFYFQLRRIKNNNLVIGYWSLFFALLACSTFLGGSAHAFFGLHEGVAYKIVWLGMQLVNGLAIYFAQQATLISVIKNTKYAKRWVMLYSIQLLLFIPSALIFQKYTVTIIENAVGLIPIMVLHFMDTQKHKSSFLIGYGIAISFITAIVHGTKISLHAYFNFNDIAHVFIMLSLLVMFLGVKKILLLKN